MPYKDKAAKAANQKSHRATDRQRYRDAERARRAAWTPEQRETHEARNAAWWRRHDGMQAAAAFSNRSNRRAALLGCVGVLTGRQVREIRGPCTYCSAVIPAGGWDHVMPLCLGGENRVGNLVRCCMRCNTAKGRKHPDVWLAALRPERPGDWNGIVATLGVKERP